jgi:ribosomal protein S18 acetylase RimI-like enzyme
VGVIAYSGESRCGAAWCRIFDGEEVEGFVGILGKGMPALVIAVGPEYRKQGVGRMLLKALFEHIQSEGFGGVSLCVSKANVPGLALYESVGMTVESEDPKRYFMVKGFSL